MLTRASLELREPFIDPVTPACMGDRQSACIATGSLGRIGSISSGPIRADPHNTMVEATAKA